MAIFRFFKTAAAAILDFLNFKLLTVARLKRVEMRRNVKFGQNRSNRSGDMPRAFNYCVRRQARAVRRSQGDQRVLANIALFVVDGEHAS